MTERGRENRNDFPQTLSPGHSDINSQKCISRLKYKKKYKRNTNTNTTTNTREMISLKLSLRSLPDINSQKCISKLKCKKKYKRNTNTNTNTNTRELLAQSSPVPAIGKTCKISWHFFRMTAILTLLKRQEEYVWKPKGKTKASYALFLCIQRSFRATQNPETNCLQTSKILSLQRGDKYKRNTNTNAKEIPTQIQKSIVSKRPRSSGWVATDVEAGAASVQSGVSCVTQTQFASTANILGTLTQIHCKYTRWHKYILSAHCKYDTYSDKHKCWVLLVAKPLICIRLHLIWVVDVLLHLVKTKWLPWGSSVWIQMPNLSWGFSFTRLCRVWSSITSP